jgi:hypothetical protein
MSNDPDRNEKRGGGDKDDDEEDVVACSATFCGRF